MYEGQDVLSCTITECGHPEENPDFVKTLRDEDLKLPPGRPANLEIQTTYSFDDNGLMHCSFKDVESGDKKDIQIGDIDPSSSGPNKMDEFTVD